MTGATSATGTANPLYINGGHMYCNMNGDKIQMCDWNPIGLINWKFAVVSC